MPATTPHPRLLVLLTTSAAVLLSLVAAFVSQASSPDYQQLAWSVSVPMVMALAMSAAAYRLLPVRTRFLPLLPLSLAVISYGELVLRAWQL